MLSRPRPDYQSMKEDATGIPVDRINYAIRLGLGDPDQLYFYTQAIQDPERAVQNPQLRPVVAEVAERALRLIFDDPQMWTRAQTILRRMFPNQIAARMSEAAYNSLSRRAARNSVPLEQLLEAYETGYEEGGEDRAFAAVNSYIDTRNREEELRRPEILAKIRRAMK